MNPMQRLTPVLSVIAVSFFSVFSQQSAHSAFIDPAFSGLTQFASWDNFTTASGDNMPDAGLSGFAPAPTLRQTAIGAFVTSSGNLYSFSGSLALEIDAASPSPLGTIALQFNTIGTEIDYSTIRLHYGAAFGQSLAPTNAALLDLDTSGGFTDAFYIAQWDLSALSISNYRITFESTGSSSSFAAARLDTSTQYKNVVPLAPIISSSNRELLYTGSSFTYQIEASGSPFFYSALGLPPGLSIDNSTGIISGEPTLSAAGQHVVTLQVYNGQASDTFALTLDIFVPTTFAQWASGFSLPAGQAAATDDPDNDGLSNIEEYFHDANPLIPDDDGLIQTSVTQRGVIDELTMTFAWNEQAADIAIEVWIAETLPNWELADGALTLTLEKNEGRASYVLEESDQLFMQLRLVTP